MTHHTDCPRHIDWQARLVRYLASVSAQPYAAGMHDCALFTGGAVEAMTGDNPAAGHHGTYRTIRGGVRALKKAGHADHVAFVAAHFEEVVPAFAHTGDIAVVAGADGFAALGIVQGESVYVLTDAGMAIVCRLNMQRAFRV